MSHIECEDCEPTCAANPLGNLSKWRTVSATNRLQKNANPSPKCPQERFPAAKTRESRAAQFLTELVFTRFQKTASISRYTSF